MFNELESLNGNEPVKRYLMRMLQEGTIAHSFLFAGSEEVNKRQFAEAFARALLQTTDSTHPDLHINRPEGKIGMHSVDSIRRFTDEVYLAPFSSPWKVFIIDEADRMLPFSANALLKTFEEPPERTVIILISSSPENLLPTILSRCQIVRFERPLNQQKEEQQNQLNELLLDALAGNRLNSYSNIKELAQQVSDEMEKRKGQWEADLREEATKGFRDSLTAVQKDLIEKEILGAVAMRARKDVEKLFVLILSWYRDMHLLHVNADSGFLFNPKHSAQIQQAVQRGEFKPLDTVQKALSDAALAYDRFTSLNICLETFFLKINA